MGALAAALVLPPLQALIEGQRRGGRKFTIWGVTRARGLRIRRLPEGRLGFGLTALGRVTGALRGRFSFAEQGEATLRTARGANEGAMSVVTAEGNRLAICFGGQTDLRRVWGTWRVVDGAEWPGGLRGSGVYIGNAGLVFVVTFVDQ